jgi:hypothetical protein
MVDPLIVRQSERRLMMLYAPSKRRELAKGGITKGGALQLFSDLVKTRRRQERSE